MIFDCSYAAFNDNIVCSVHLCICLYLLLSFNLELILESLEIDVLIILQKFKMAAAPQKSEQLDLLQE